LIIKKNLKQQQTRLQVEKKVPVDDNMSTKERIDSFTNELNEFKVSVCSFFNEEDPANFLSKLSVVKDTKAAEEIFKTLNEEMKVYKRVFYYIIFSFT